MVSMLCAKSGVTLHNCESSGVQVRWHCRLLHGSRCNIIYPELKQNSVLEMLQPPQPQPLCSNCICSLNMLSAVHYTLEPHRPAAVRFILASSFESTRLRNPGVVMSDLMGLTCNNLWGMNNSFRPRAQRGSPATHGMAVPPPATAMTPSANFVFLCFICEGAHA